MWATGVLVAIGGYQLLLAQGRSPINLVFISVLLAVLAGASLIRPSVGAATLLILGVLLALPPPMEWLSLVLPPGNYKGDLRWIGSLTVFVVGLITAIWRRPPTRRPDGTLVVASRLVNWLALLCAVGGPVIGWAVFAALTPGDLFGRDAMVGLIGTAVGLFGLVLFSGYSAFHVLTRAPGRAAILAVAYPLGLGPLVMSAPLWVAPRVPVPEAIVENRLADGRLVSASHASPAGPPVYAIDGRADTAWNAGTHPPSVDRDRPW